ncbi:MAG: pyrroline-5-carboxylate reductase [Burkholderiaceae bacterium]|nr:pyrroline-5-carboxylate reductase [Burkholderiaceae bacterium]MCD8516296.1 pyrroline-5-carboxylate reductase [Burkholderiaceae bacterium]MCD8537153.1 pyrroline-5-carboxylate reductase [Burkholderiaceae bacterium]MCD8566301.1 pyrroline-5-carboxylate reductase [Burkholderiaceae bacterium]
MTTHIDIAFVGGGNMAGALIEGLLKRGVPAKRLHVIDVNGDTRSRWRELGLSVASEPDEELSRHHVWVLAVKPQQLADVVQQCKPFLTPLNLVLSIAAGISLSSLSHWLGTLTDPWPLVVRAMPNTPALVEKGMTGLAAGSELSAEHRSHAQNIMSAVGDVIWVESDDMIDAVTAVSGSGPAYVFRFIEAMMDGARTLGLDDVQAKQLTLATLAGATELAAQSVEPVSVLRERVTSKGGTTQAALDVMHTKGFGDIVQKAMKAAYDRAGELSREFGEQPQKK